MIIKKAKEVRAHCLCESMKRFKKYIEIRDLSFESFDFFFNLL